MQSSPGGAVWVCVTCSLHRKKCSGRVSRTWPPKSLPCTRGWPPRPTRTRCLSLPTCHPHLCPGSLKLGNGNTGSFVLLTGKSQPEIEQCCRSLIRPPFTPPQLNPSPSLLPLVFYPLPLVILHLLWAAFYCGGLDFPPLLTLHLPDEVGGLKIIQREVIARKAPS